MNAEPKRETRDCDKPAMRDLAEGVLALLGDDCFLVLNERNNENGRLKMKQSIAHAMTKGNVCHDGMKGIFVQPHCDDAKECLFLRFVGEPYVIEIDSSRRAIVCKVRASGLTGLQLEYHEPSAPAADPQQAALNSLRVRYAPTMLYPPARAAFEAALNSRGGSGTEVPRSEETEEPLNESELAALRALGGGIDPAQVAADAELVAREMMAGLEVATNGCTKPGCEKHPRKGDATGAMQAKQKGGRGSKGNPKNPTTQSNTPLKAAPGAKAQAQVDATEHALKAREGGGGVVEGAAWIDGKRLDIPGGSPDTGGASHMKKHYKPGDTSRREAAKDTHLGRKQKDRTEVASVGKKNKVILADKGDHLRPVTTRRKTDND